MSLGLSEHFDLAGCPTRRSVGPERPDREAAAPPRFATVPVTGYPGGRPAEVYVQIQLERAGIAGRHTDGDSDGQGTARPYCLRTNPSPLAGNYAGPGRVPGLASERPEHRARPGRAARTEAQRVGRLSGPGLISHRARTGRPSSCLSGSE